MRLLTTVVHEFAACREGRQSVESGTVACPWSRSLAAQLEVLDPLTSMLHKGTSLRYSHWLINRDVIGSIRCYLLRLVVQFVN